MMLKQLKRNIGKILRKKKTEISQWDSFAEILNSYCFHSNAGKEIKATFGPALDSTHENDLTILKTIKKIYNFNKEAFGTKTNDDIWQNFIMPKHRDFVDALENNRDERILDYFNNMFCNELTWGFAARSKEVDKAISANDKLKNGFKLFYMDTLVCFAEWLGAIPVENIEQAKWGESVCLSPEYLIELIEKKLGLELKFPEFQKGLNCILTKKGNFFNRHFIYLYIALKIKEFCKDKPNPSICEIGGGAGYLAFYCDLVGLNDVTIVDIPFVNLVSSYFLMKNMPKTKFLFNFSEDKYAQTEAVKLLTPEYFLDSDKKYDIVINCDSFPEINSEIAQNYLEQIKRKSELFYSINQEAAGPMWGLDLKQNIVPDLINKTGGFVRKSRNLFWLRRGYVEELYEVEK